MFDLLILVTELAPQTSSSSASDFNKISQTQVNLFLNNNLILNESKSIYYKYSRHNSKVTE